MIRWVQETAACSEIVQESEDNLPPVSIQTRELTVYLRLPQQRFVAFVCTEFGPESRSYLVYLIAERRHWGYNATCGLGSSCCRRLYDVVWMHATECMSPNTRSMPILSRSKMQYHVPTAVLIRTHGRSLMPWSAIKMRRVVCAHFTNLLQPLHLLVDIMADDKAGLRERRNKESKRGDQKKKTVRIYISACKCKAQVMTIFLALAP